MENDYLIEFSLHRGRFVAGYLTLPHSEEDTVAYSRKVRPGYVVDFTEDDRAIGIEMTTPSLVSLKTLNEILKELGRPSIKEASMAPLAAK